MGRHPASPRRSRAPRRRCAARAVRHGVGRAGRGRPRKAADPRPGAALVELVEEATQRLRHLRRNHPASGPGASGRRGRRPGGRGRAGIRRRLAGFGLHIEDARRAPSDGCACGAARGPGGSGVRRRRRPALEQALQEGAGLGEPAFAGEAGRFEHVGGRRHGVGGGHVSSLSRGRTGRASGGEARCTSRSGCGVGGGTRWRRRPAEGVRAARVVSGCGRRGRP